jgi:cytochrome c biogenesis protein CcmG/thiol:disulfide interchange protein DsbE
LAASPPPPQDALRPGCPWQEYRRDPSALIGTKAPSLDLPPLEGANLPALTDAAVKGKLTLVNVFASWCIPCREEHPMLKELAKDSRLNIVAINYKDKNDNALGFLGELGNPYKAIGVDPKGQAAIDWGVYGIPESYLVAPTARSSTSASARSTTSA